jgi:hypothetical protein
MQAGEPLPIEKGTPRCCLLRGVEEQKRFARFDYTYPLKSEQTMFARRKHFAHFPLDKYSSPIIEIARIC